MAMAASASHLSLTQLATLRELARLGSLSAVASALDYSAGAVSQHLTMLERAVGSKLVVRAGRHLILTDAGHLLARHAERLLATEREAIRSVAALKGQVAGPLTVGTWGSTAATLLAPVIRRLAAQYPEVTVRSKEVDLDAAASAVRNGRVDIAFGLDYLDAPLPRHQGIEILELHEEPFAVALAAEPGGKRTGTADLALLADLSWILPPTTSQFGTAIRTGFRNRGFEPIVVHEVTDTAASLQLAAAGLGATVMTPLMRKLNPDLELLELRMPEPLTRRIVLLAPSTQVQPSVRAFTTVVSEVVAAMLGPDRH